MLLYSTNNEMTKTSKHILLIIILSLLFVNSKSYCQDKLQVSGFVSSMPTFMFSDISQEWINDFTFHNRFDFSYTPTSTFTFEAGLRNRILTGDMITSGMIDVNNYNTDQGWLDMTENIASGKSYAFNSSIDRLFMNITFNKLEITLGRQRINWGISTAWNPNDIFNAYSFFDFDYIKRPGSDALRFKYYTGNTSVVEFATSLDNNKKVTSALFSRFSLNSFDLQFSGGIFKSDDIYLGAGWSGYFNRVGFKGEISTFVPYKNKINREQIWSATIGVDYIFENSLTIITELLYQKNNNQQLLSDDLFTSKNIDARSLSFSEYSLFASTSYPITPLLKASFSAMYYPSMPGFFINPSIEYSISNNWYLSAITQYFNIETEETKTKITMLYLRLKANF